jgi:hypothetical protein
MDSRLLQLQKELEAATKGMSPEDLAWHPDGKWCAAQILEHLYLTYANSTKGFERCLAAGQPLARKPTVKDRMKTLAVVNLGYIPEGRKAPKGTIPRGAMDEKILENVAAEIEKLDSTIAECEQRHGRHIKLLDHPIIGPLNGNQWRGFHLTHGRHHIKQIKRLRQAAR